MSPLDALKHKQAGDVHVKKKRGKRGRKETPPDSPLSKIEAPMSEKKKKKEKKRSQKEKPHDSIRRRA